MSIIILSAPIRSGKTTLLQKYIARHCAIGFLCPDHNSVRKLYDIKNNTFYDLEINQVDANVLDASSIVTIGKFLFLKDTFWVAQQILLDCSNDTSNDIIIDEIGKLELNDDGLEPALTKFLAYKKLIIGDATNAQKIILVIRDTLLDACVEKYNLQSATILDIAHFGSTFGLA